MECKITGITKFYCDGNLVGVTNYNGNAFANPHMEITRMIEYLEKMTLN